MIRENSQASVQISFLGPLESVNKIHKFLVQVVICSDPEKANWKSAEVREFKISTKFEGEEFRPEERDIKDSFMKESVYGDAEELKEDISSYEEKKKIITSKNSELTGSIDKLQSEIDKATHKLRFSKDIDIMVSESVGKYGIPHLVAVFVLGLLIGYYILG